MLKSVLRDNNYQPELPTGKPMRNFGFPALLPGNPSTCLTLLWLCPLMLTPLPKPLSLVAFQANLTQLSLRRMLTGCPLLSFPCGIPPRIKRCQWAPPTSYYCRMHRRRLQPACVELELPGLFPFTCLSPGSAAGQQTNGERMVNWVAARDTGVEEACVYQYLQVFP